MQLRLQQSALAAENAAHCAAVILCRKVHAPIRRLSFDVLGEIARHCIPDFIPRQPTDPLRPSESLEEPANKAIKFPFVFTHVCSAWRAAALSSPWIWTTLRLTIDGTDSLVSMNKRTEIVTEWFRRARQLPLSLFINIDDCAYLPSLDMHEEHKYKIGLVEAPWGCFLTSLSPFIPRLRRLSITSNTTECLRPILEHPVTWDLRSLQSLYIRSKSYPDFSDEDIDYPHRTDSHLFSAAPALTHLNLNCMVAEREDLGQSLPWSQLTHLHIFSGITVLDWVAVMELCPLLKTGIFGLESLDDSDFPPPDFPLLCSSATHDDLESLAVHLPGEKPYSYSPLELLHAFRLPNLRYLDASRGIDPNRKVTSTEAPHSDIRTYTSLKCLSFCDDRSDCLPKLLKETPSLCELSVATRTTFPTTLFTVMTYTPHSNFCLNLNILPHLNTLILAFKKQIHPPNLEILKKMLLSRTNETIPIGCRRLKKVTFLTRNEKLESTLKVLLEECNFSGVEVILKRTNADWENVLPKYVVI